jgi:hypothetical protein
MLSFEQLELVHECVILGICDEHGIALVVGAAVLVDLIDQLAMSHFQALKFLHVKSLKPCRDSAHRRNYKLSTDFLRTHTHSHFSLNIGGATGWDSDSLTQMI